MKLKNLFNAEIISVGLAIFSMFFGAGNLMYPIKAGMDSGINHFSIGILGFLITSILLPLLGLVAMILYDGNYKAFIFRLGKIPGYVLMFALVLIIGPLIAMPRIITLSYTMMAPFMPSISLPVFIFIFLLITFLCTFRENSIVNLLGKFISPALLISLTIIIVKGILLPGNTTISSANSIEIFKQNFWLGYETLDLLAAIFFSSIILNILKRVHKTDNNFYLAYLSFKSGMIGLALLAIIYLGLGVISMFHGYGLENINAGELFKEVSFRILGSSGAVVISIAVFMACLSTAIALAAVVSDFFQSEIFRKKISFSASLIMVLLLCIPLSVYGLSTVLKLTAGPIVYILYPAVIALTILNICYKLFGFKPVKIPVLIVALLALVNYLGLI